MCSAIGFLLCTLAIFVNLSGEYECTKINFVLMLLTKTEVVSLTKMQYQECYNVQY